MTEPDGDPTFPTPPLRHLLRMAAETFAATLACGLVAYGGYLALPWFRRLLGADG